MGMNHNSTGTSRSTTSWSVAKSRSPQYSDQNPSKTRTTRMFANLHKWLISPCYHTVISQIAKLRRNTIFLVNPPDVTKMQGMRDTSDKNVTHTLHFRVHALKLIGSAQIQRWIKLNTHSAWLYGRDLLEPIAKKYWSEPLSIWTQINRYGTYFMVGAKIL